MKPNPYLRETSSNIVLGNRNADFSLSRKDGTIQRMVHQRQHLQWNQTSGWLEIYDGLADKHYRTGENASETAVRISQGAEPSVVLSRRFPGAQFLVVETFRATLDAVCWEVELVLDKGAKQRSVEVRQLVPWPKEPWGWGVWSANFNFPTFTHNVAGLHLEYGDICFGTVIPAVTVYHPQKDVGLAIAKPFGLPTPRLRFCFTDYRSDGIRVENSLLGLRPGTPVRVAVMLRFQEGCFRPTLAWLLQKYPDYFLPGNPGVRKMEGGSIFGPPQVTPSDVANLRKAGIVWYEIHHSMPYYGQYCPETKEWRDGSSPPDSLKRRQKPITQDMINDCGKALGKHGISSLLYFQVTGDVWLPMTRKKYSQSLAKDADGHVFQSIVDGAMINSDPTLPFGREMQRQIKGVLARYPDVSGIFLDQACYNMTDHVHDDGITMDRNKPVYRLRFNYDRHLGELVAGLHRQGKFIYANGPYDIELQRGFDGNMAESTAANAGTMKYMHIAKPLLFFAYCKSADDVEDMLQECLLAGASWSIWVKLSRSWFIKKGITPDQQQIYARYLPLCRRLLGRKILLEPQPLSLIKQGDVFAGEGQEVTIGDARNRFLDGEIFQGEDGDILISLVSRRKRCLETDNLSKDVRLIVRTRQAKRVFKAFALGADYRGQKPVKFQRQGRRLSLTIPAHGAASLIILQVKRPR